MPQGRKKKVTTVHAHLMRVPPSKKNPDGITTSRQHPRNIYTSYTIEDLKKIAQNYRISKIPRPTADNLDYPDGNKYDVLIAIWVDFFNKVFPPKPPFSLLDPNLIKALFGSESEFKVNPKNRKAFGIAQITPQTYERLSRPNKEITDHLFKDIRQKHLLDPELCIPYGIRWIFHKKRLAEGKLGRPPTPEEIILEYKGLLKSQTPYKTKALVVFRKRYAKLTKK